MMPFSVLRMWSLGIVGWAIFGLGIYCVYRWAAPAPQALATHDVIEASRPNPEFAEVTTVSVVQTNRNPVLLVVGITLLVLSTFGGVPVVWILRQLSAAGPRSFRSSKVQTIDRPDGSKLYVEHYGISTGPTLVFTHGWSLDRTAWYYTKQALEDRFHLVLWDLAGLGRSTAPRNKDHSLEKMAADLQAVIDKAADGPVVLIGHSIGGMIIQTFCRLFPAHLSHRVIGLVFVHTTYTNPVKTTILGKALAVLQKPVLEPLNYLTLWLSPLVWLSNCQSYWNGSLHLSTRLTSFAGTQTWNQIDYSSRLLAFASPAVLARGNFAMSKFDAQETLSDISVPTLVVAGKNDRLTCKEASTFMCATIPKAQLVQLGPAGHLGHWEQHAEFNLALAEFCGSLSSPPSTPAAFSRKGAPALV